jgi:hypothetical protein
MFRQLTAIFRGLHVPRKLLQYCLCLGWMWIMVRSVWPCRGNLMSIIKAYNTLVYVSPRSTKMLDTAIKTAYSITSVFCTSCTRLHIYLQKIRH